MLGAAVLAAVAIGALVGRPPAPAEPLAGPPIVAPAADDVDTITVHVGGAVRSPGLVEVPAGTRVAEALAAAGGANAQAALGTINLAATLVDGQQIVVPGVGAGSGPPVAAEVGDGLVHVNTADQAELETLPGVGPVLAAGIVSFREQFGPFAVVEDLLGVPGIGEAKLAALREHIAVP